MVAIPSSSPTLLSSVSIFSASSAPPSSHHSQPSQHSRHNHIQYNNHNHNHNHNHKNNKNNNTNQVAPSSPDSSCSNSCASSPRFPCLDPISGRTLSHTSSGHISSSFQRPIISTSTSTPNKMQRSSPSSSIPSPPEHNIHYYNSSLLVKGPHPSSTSLDHVFPNPRTKTLGPDDRSSSDYYNHRRMHSNSNNKNNNSEDDDASSVVVDHQNNNKNGSHSRIDIANLLCTSGTTPSSNGPTRNTSTSNNSLPPPPPPHTTNVNSNVHSHHHDPKSLSQQQQQQKQQQQGLRAITEEADDHEVSPHHRYRQLPSYPDSRNGNHTSSHYNNSNGNGNTNGSYSSTSTGPSREPLTQRVVAVDAPGAAPSSAPYYRPPTSSSTSSSASHVGARPASFSAGSTPTSSSSGPLYSSGGSSSSSSSAAVYTSAPSRSKLPGPQQRSASWNTDRYQDYGQGHSSTTSYEQEQQRRTDRSKSDYALHQQNYGPYLDSSPPLSAATLPRSNGTTTSSSSSSLNSAPPSSSIVKMPASGAEPPASLYYQQPQPQQQQQSQPQAPPSQQAQHQQQHSQQQPSASTPALSSSPSAYYSNVPSNGGHGTPNSVRSLSAVSSSSRSMRDYPHAQSSDSSANEQLRRPTLPPPSALLSGADVKPARIYGRDSTAEDLWPPHPRPSRVVPIDAPNEKRPYSFDNSAMLPPVLPPPTSSAPSSSSSSSLLPYSSSYSNGSMEQKQRRIYGIDAADVPSRFAAPPALPSSYGSNGHYSKRPQDSSDGIEGGESRKRVFGRDSADTYQQRPYGSNTTAPSSSAPSYGGTPSYGYNAPPPPPPQPSVSQSHHYSSSDMDRSSRYEEYKHRGWSNGQPPSSSSSSMAHGGPAYGSSVPTSSSRAYPRAQSPDIKPPSWYQDYANSVLPKPQTQPAYQQQRSDSGYYGSSNHHYQQQQHHHHSSSHGYGKSSSLAGIHEMEEDEDGNLHRSSKSSKRSKTGMGSSPSVHPFDNADPNSTSSSSSKSKKPKRIKNAAGQEDMIVMDDEFYAVKAKRKRANASQLSVLNAAFERSYFPSTEERLRLSKQCRMCPRTVQIWFQNKRQSVKARSEAMEAAVNGTAITDELLESRLQMLEEETNGSAGDGQKRSTGDMIEEDFEGDEESGPGEHADHSAHHRHHHSSGSGSGSSSSKPRRSSGNPASGSSNGNGHLTPSDAVMSALHIQLDGRSVDYFSRKRRATIAKMERNEQQKKEKEELQRKREQEQQLIIQQYQKHQQEQLQQQRLQQQQQEGQTVGHN